MIVKVQQNPLRIAEVTSYFRNRSVPIPFLIPNNQAIRVGETVLAAQFAISGIDITEVRSIT